MSAKMDLENEKNKIEMPKYLRMQRRIIEINVFKNSPASKYHTLLPWRNVSVFGTFSAHRLH